ncbi:MAG TPA: hypothetical protein VHP37_24505 [Burkholderiales bacterium]|nr:hypothetical protein [Burkholderiales bacterium]
MVIVAGVACLFAGMALAAVYPLGAAWAATAFAAAGIVFYKFEESWLVWVPALLPVIGFATWTGSITFEEFDLLVLAAAGAGYLRRAVDDRSRLEPKRQARPDVVAYALITAFAVSTVIAFIRGWYPGDEGFGYWQGYDGPMNSLRIAKPFILAVLLLPLLRSALARDGALTARRLSLGATIGLAAACLTVVWERAAFPGLLDFSADYRATAFFWEMHVGGAALDGFIALTVPFAVWRFQRAHSNVHRTVLTLVLGIAAYACLVTFSRALYVAVLAGVALLVTLQLKQERGERSTTIIGALSLAALFACVTALLCFVAFRHGGYRALAAVLDVGAVSILQAPLVRSSTLSQQSAGAAVGVLGGAGLLMAACMFSKGPYVLFGIALAAAVGVAMAAHKTPFIRVAAVATYVCSVMSAGAVAAHWGGVEALRDASASLAAVTAVAAWNARARVPLWPEERRAALTLIGSALLVGAVVAVFSAGAYMGGRVSTAERDISGRIQHWGTGLALLSGLDWFAGKGLGRFPGAYFYEAPAGELPGSYRIVASGGESFLALGGPRHMLGFGELFRISQRVSASSAGVYTVSLKARAAEQAALHVEICEKHLLYVGACAVKAVALQAAPGEWRPLTIALDGTQFGRGPWYAPRLAFFSMAVETKGRLIDVDEVQVVGPDGRSQIHNGDFAGGMSRWFFTSDKHHLPWHMKNMLLALLFDQGVLGLTCLLLLVATAFVRVAFGIAARSAVAPALAASLAGFLVVGLTDSLLDIPRIAFLFYLLVGAAVFAPTPTAIDSQHAAPRRRIRNSRGNQTDTR